MGKWPLLGPVNILAGTIMGAGMFALPYLFARAGVLTGTVYLLVFGGVFYIVHLMYADLLRRENNKLVFPGIAKKYLGRGGEYLAYVSGVFVLILSLTAYIILEMMFLGVVFPAVPETYAFIFFWATGTLSFMLWRTVKIAPLEVAANAATILIIGILIAFSLGDGTRVNLPVLFSAENLFLPFGTILFALAGRTAIPAVLVYLRGASASRIVTAIFLGTAIPVAVYLLFVYGVLAVSPSPTEDSIGGMIGSVPPFVVSLLGIMGILSLWGSYIIIAKVVRDSFHRDMKKSYFTANTVVAVAPVALYIAGFQNFLQTIDVIGGVFLAIESILIVLIWIRASKEISSRSLITRLHPSIPVLLLLVFFTSIMHQLIK